MKYTRSEVRKLAREIEDKWFDEWRALGTREKRPDWHYTDAISDLYEEWRKSLDVGDKVHICHWSDVTPGTVVKKTKTTLTIRHDKYHLDDVYKPKFIPGGFSAYCENNDEQNGHWIIEDDPDGTTEIFRWSKRFNRYRNTSEESCEPEWDAFYDYNF